MISQKTRDIVIAAIIVLSMAASTIWVTYNASGIMSQSYENENRMVAGVVSNVIDNSFIKPITVSETISKDPTMRTLLCVGSQEQAKAESAEAGSFLKSIRDTFGYSMVFAISDKTKAYYTPDGLTRFIDPQNNSADTWYTSAVTSGKSYLLDVDVDQAANWALSIFVNTPVLDANDKLLGLTGVAVDITELQKVIGRYERMYDVKINLVNEQGVIQLDSDASRIENASIQVENLASYKDGQQYYEIRNDGTRTITYLKALDWYLVVQNNNNVYSKVSNFWIPGLVCTIIGASLVAAVFILSRKNPADE